MSKDSNDKGVPTGMVEVEFLKDHGSFKKGDSEVYHKTTAAALEKHKILKVTKTLKEYAPKKAEK